MDSIDNKELDQNDKVAIYWVYKETGVLLSKWSSDEVFRYCHTCFRYDKFNCSGPNQADFYIIQDTLPYLVFSKLYFSDLYKLNQFDSNDALLLLNKTDIDQIPVYFLKDDRVYVNRANGDFMHFRNGIWTADNNFPN